MLRFFFVLTMEKIGCTLISRSYKLIGEFMKYVEVSEDDRFSEDFIEPSKYFIINGFNNAVYFHTNSRQKAQEQADLLFGVGKYKIRTVIRAILR